MIFGEATLRSCSGRGFVGFVGFVDSCFVYKCSDFEMSVSVRRN